MINVEGNDLEIIIKWNFIQSFGLLKVGEGYTMKGTGGTENVIDANQNYVCWKT
jgi:hypothetical protein